MIKRFLAILAALCVMTSMTSSAFAQNGDDFTDAPDDAFYLDERDLQWNLKRINMSKVWAKGSKGYRGEGATVCVIDSGLNLKHEDLGAKVVETYNVFDKSKDVADTYIQYVRHKDGEYVKVDDNMVYIEDFLKNGGVLTSETKRYTTSYGHGTNVTSVISASINNEVGMAGIADKADIVVVKAFDNEKETTIDTLVDALEYVAEKHPEVGVINMSLGTDEKMEESERKKFQAAIDKVVGMGMIVIAAVGNNGEEVQSNGKSAVSYPAGLNNVIGVGGIDENYEKCVFSQFNESVFISAPGDYVGDDIIIDDTEDEDEYRVDKAIPTLDAEGDYCMVNGTSIAAPHVSGVAAIAKSIYPKLTSNQFKEILKRTSADLDATPSYFNEAMEEQWSDLTGYDELYGYGLIDADKIITEVEKLANNEYNADNYRTLEYVKDDKGASIVVETDDLDASVYIASYDNDTLSSVRRVDIGDLESEMDDNGNYCRYQIPLLEDEPEPSKLFLWHDMISHMTWEPSAEPSEPPTETITE